MTERSQGQMDLSLRPGTPDDVTAIVHLRNAVAENLTAQYGRGHWSTLATERGVLSAMKQSTIWVARNGDDVLATVRLSTKKPWAIDASYFTPSKRALYLTDMAVHPRMQHRGMGRRVIDDAKRIAREWPADAIRLDAYDAAAGAGEFYGKCGFREVGRVSYKGTPLIYFEMLL